MKALAEFLSDGGWTISGSDQAALPVTLQAQDFQFYHGHNAAAVPEGADLVVFSPAIPADNVERVAAAERGIPSLSYAQALGRLSRQSRAVCVAGTHGKSTTSALLAHLLASAGRSPSAIVGAEMLGTGRSGYRSSGDLLVLESCEYQRHFLELKPYAAAILDVEPDHFDCFPEFDTALEAYRRFADGVDPSGVLVIPAGSQAVWSIIAQQGARLVTFGAECPAEWMAEDICVARDGTAFDLKHHGRKLARVRLRLHGRHNVANALAAFALAEDLTNDRQSLLEGLESFPGIRRRFEIVAESGDLVLVDDYAHHPTAIAYTLATLRDVFPGRPLLCAFQPHQISRTRELLESFARSLSAFDHVDIPPVFAARENGGEDAFHCSQTLAEAVRRVGGNARALESLDRIAPTMEDEARPGDILITMGAGDIDRTHHDLIGRLFRDPHAR